MQGPQPGVTNTVQRRYIPALARHQLQCLLVGRGRKRILMRESLSRKYVRHRDSIQFSLLKCKSLSL